MTVHGMLEGHMFHCLFEKVNPCEYSVVGHALIRNTWSSQLAPSSRSFYKTNHARRQVVQK